MDYNNTPKEPQNTPKFNCEHCNFSTCNKKDFNRHLNTVKHKKIIDMKNDNKIPQSTPKTYKCIICEKNYKHASTLSRHKKTCSINNNKKIESNLINFLNNFEKIETENEIFL